MPVPILLDVIMEVMANLSRRGHSQRNLWIISWCLAHTELLVLTLPRASRSTVVPKIIGTVRKKELGILCFSLIVKGVDGREGVVAESYNRHTPEVVGSLCIAGGQLHSTHNRGGKVGRGGVEQEGQAPKDWRASKKRVSFTRQVCLLLDSHLLPLNHHGTQISLPAV